MQVNRKTATGAVEFKRRWGGEGEIGGGDRAGKRAKGGERRR